MKTKTCALVASVGLSLFTPAVASAKPFATDAFSIELGDPPPCFVVPASLSDADACRGLPPAGASDIDNTQIGLMAAAGLRPSREASPSGEKAPLLIGLVQMFKKPADLPLEPEPALAERVAIDATKSILADLPSEARRSRPIPRIENVDGLVVVRTAVDVDGLTPGTRASFFAHIETATVFGRDATYTIVWSGPASSTKTLIRLADDATKTVRLVPEQHPAARNAGLASVAGSAKMLLPLGALGFALLVGGALYVRRRRKMRPLRAELWPMPTE
jgi:hypothetical protein